MDGAVVLFLQSLPALHQSRLTVFVLPQVLLICLCLQLELVTHCQSLAQEGRESFSVIMHFFVIFIVKLCLLVESD